VHDRQLVYQHLTNKSPQYKVHILRTSRTVSCFRIWNGREMHNII